MTRAEALDSFSVDESAGTLDWKHHGAAVHVVVPGLVTADAYREQAVVLALLQEMPTLQATLLKVFSADGSECFELQPPPGFFFYYLTRHIEMPIAVVCVTANGAPFDHWHDWQFGVDLQKRTLQRIGPAY